jgi:hypothetical protein
MASRKDLFELYSLEFTLKWTDRWDLCRRKWNALTFTLPSPALASPFQGPETVLNYPPQWPTFILGLSSLGDQVKYRQITPLATKYSKFDFLTQFSKNELWNSKPLPKMKNYQPFQKHTSHPLISIIMITW